MPSSADSIDTVLQICFGVLGVVGVLAAIASISYETSVGAYVYRRLRDSVQGLEIRLSCCRKLTRSRSECWIIHGITHIQVYYQDSALEETYQRWIVSVRTGVEGRKSVACS